MPIIREKMLIGPMAWSADTMLKNDGLISLDQNCQLELDHVAAEIEANPLPAIALKSEDFDLPNCKRAMRQAYDQITTGIGFAIIDRLPVDRFDKDAVTKIYWLLMSMISWPVAQKWDGTLIYDVLDTGQKVGAGSDVRSSKTHAGQGYHIDNAFNLPPVFVGLMCLQIAREGGAASLVSRRSTIVCLMNVRKLSRDFTSRFITTDNEKMHRATNLFRKSRYLNLMVKRSLPIIPHASFGKATRSKVKQWMALRKMR